MFLSIFVKAWWPILVVYLVESGQFKKGGKWSFLKKAEMVENEEKWKKEFWRSGKLQKEIEDHHLVGEKAGQWGEIPTENGGNFGWPPTKE